MPRRRSNRESFQEYAAKMVVTMGFVLALCAWGSGNTRLLEQFVAWVVLTGLLVGAMAFLVFLGKVFLSPTAPTEGPAPLQNLPGQSAQVSHAQAPSPATSKPAPKEPSMAEQLRALDWFQFEKLVQLWFARQGYRVEKRGGANPDGGVDFVAFKDGQFTLVQCKHWRKWQVKPNHVRELLGAMTKEKAARCVLVATGGFTDFARQEAATSGVELIDGGAVIRWLEEERFTPGWDQVKRALDAENKWCPRCENPLVRRVARKGTWTGREFWGCSTYPRCDCKMPIDENPSKTSVCDASWVRL